MLISDYLSSNVIVCIFFYLTHSRELWQKYKNIFIRFGFKRNFKIYFLRFTRNIAKGWTKGLQNFRFGPGSGCDWYVKYCLYTMSVFEVECPKIMMSFCLIKKHLNLIKMHQDIIQRLVFIILLMEKITLISLFVKV